MFRQPLLLLTLIALLPRMLCAQSAAPDTPESGSVEEIAQATTEARFLSPWVAYLPASAQVVSPRTFLHRIPGAPGELVNSATAYAYCRALAGSSPRVRMFTLGRSEEGRDIVLLAIADEQGIRDLERCGRRPRRSPTPAGPMRRPPQASSPRRARSTTSMPDCTRTRPARPSRCSSSLIAWRCPSSR